ncbi:hypothetical protein GCM10027429_04530 [Marivirga atlantica]|jgi:two-component system phosphate regulon sensor histidine kinase PhoR|uniref:histidine kinase n=1 Tax=Marivirga atlantica TaxID=1548457 RepID=A0A937A5K5_9BACT|nr:HAMP domain-containing sensor histidine kinase [Marivirga atlantica]MBL0764062.1 HAMP domain-containing histidine kinase [Marivirga atlantica]
MNARKFKWVGVTVVLLIGLTTVVQGIYLYSDYLDNKKAYKLEVQQALDRSVEVYYAELAKTDVLTFTDTRDFDIEFGVSDSLEQGNDSIIIKSFFQRFSNSKLAGEHIKKLDSLTGFNKYSAKQIDSLNISYISVETIESDTNHIMLDEQNEIMMLKGDHKLDSISQLKNLANKIIISITRDTLDFEKLNQILQKELERDGYSIVYSLSHFVKDSVRGQFNAESQKLLPFKTTSNSIYLPKRQSLSMNFENASLIILRKGLWNILLSIFFTLLVSAVLIFLYRIIKSQKALSEIKNDLISNITHEFKTPIATVSTAIEGIKNFNDANDAEKTSKYLQISDQQLIKLNQMVEKLLETATMDSEQLELHKEAVNLPLLLKQLIEKYETIHPEKVFSLDLEDKTAVYVDEFHFENVLSNLIDNAAKYGGKHIEVGLKKAQKINLTITDDGGNIPKGQQQRIFEKFYRIPKGNVHDVKGFGIGLYYTKTIIEKHGGTIEVESNLKKTIFKITLP